MKKKYLLGLALLPLCLGGCASNNSNTELVIYCSGYIFNGTNTYVCNHCIELETDDVGNVVDNNKLDWYVKSVSASSCSYYSNHMHYAVLWSK